MLEQFFPYLIMLLLVGLFIRKMLPPKGVKQVSTSELQAMLKDKSNRQYVDVRTPAEYKGQRIKEFRNIPLHELNGKATNLNKNEEVVVICQSGMRSMQAARTLKKLGFKKITNVKGGMSAWRN